MTVSLPVARSNGARTIFLVSAFVTVAIMLWDHHLKIGGAIPGLTPIYFFLFTVLDYPAAICALLILVCAVLIPDAIRPRSILRAIGEHPVVVSGIAAALLCVGSLTVYQNHPLAMDEYAQLFQSRIFAAGHLAGQFPAPLINWLIPEGFQNYFLSVSPTTGRVASEYWPAFALLLTPFTWLGIPWACNPLISGLTLIAIHRLALQLFADRESAGLALLLTAASPVFFANGISYYSMPAHLLANCVYALLLLAPTSRRAFAAGVVGSIALTLHNPVPHILFALPWLVWVVRREHGLRLFCWLSAGYLPLCVLLGIGWFWFYGHLAHEGMSAAQSLSSSGLGRVGGAFAVPNSTVLLARLIGLAKIWIWAVPGLVVLAAVGAWKWRADPKCRLLLVSALLTFLGFMFVPADQGHGWGFRYFHSAWVALPILAAAALTHRPGFSTNGIAASLEQGEALTFVVACALLTLVVGVGFRAQQMHEFIAADLNQVPDYRGTEPRVVILDTTEQFYGADLVQNDPWVRGTIMRMVSRGKTEDAEMMRAAFPALHEVYDDRFGTVWSAAQPPTHSATDAATLP